MQLIDNPIIKYSFTTRAVPLEEMATVAPMYDPPRIGDLLLAEVQHLGRHTRMEVRTGVTMNLFPGDRIVGAFGNRYATDQYEGTCRRSRSRRAISFRSAASAARSLPSTPPWSILRGCAFWAW